MPGYLDRHRASRLMQELGLSVLVLAQPESIVYAAGHHPGVASFWRRAGAAFLVIPADVGDAVTAIVGDLQVHEFQKHSGIADVRSHPIWVETDRYPNPDPSKPRRNPRPAQFNLSTSLALVRDVLQERNFLNTRVGLELGFVSVMDFVTFKEVPVTWVDCTNLIERLRAVKCAGEIDNLRLAATCATAGMRGLFQAIRPGMSAADMAAHWKFIAENEAGRLGHVPSQSNWAYIAVGGDGFGPGGPAQPGDIVKIDVGCVVNGYSSDGARTVVLGEPSREAARIHAALLRAFETGLPLLRPGIALQSIYETTARAMWDNGYETYGRGHFGHGVGASIWSEEWPFISQDSDAVLEPGMVMAFETPWYIDGLGGFIIEDQILITDDGHEIMAPLTRELIRI